MVTTDYVEIRNGGYYVAGTRIGLDTILCAFREGRSAESIFESFPMIGSLAKVYGAITFLLDHPAEIEAYLREQRQLAEQSMAENPIPPEMLDRLQRAKAEAHARVA